MEFQLQRLSVPEFALPHGQHRPPHLAKLGYAGLVPFTVAFDFPRPIFLIRPRFPYAFFAVMPVPETPMHQNRLSFPDENDVWLPRQLLPVQAVPCESESAEMPADDQFWRRILAADTAHVLTATDGHCASVSSWSPDNHRSRLMRRPSSMYWRTRRMESASPFSLPICP